MPTKPWEKDEATRHSRAGKGGGVNIAVLITLLVAVAVIAVMVVVPPAQWKNLYHSLPSRWEAVRPQPAVPVGGCTRRVAGGNTWAQRDSAVGLPRPTLDRAGGDRGAAIIEVLSFRNQGGGCGIAAAELLVISLGCSYSQLPARIFASNRGKLYRWTAFSQNVSSGN
jgi:hypothetical protein